MRCGRGDKSASAEHRANPILLYRPAQPARPPVRRAPREGGLSSADKDSLLSGDRQPLYCTPSSAAAAFTPSLHLPFLSLTRFPLFFSFSLSLSLSLHPPSTARSRDTTRQRGAAGSPARTAGCVNLYALSFGWSR